MIGFFILLNIETLLCDIAIYVCNLYAIQMVKACCMLLEFIYVI